MTAIHPSTIATDDRGIVKTLRPDHSLPLWSREGWDQAGGGFLRKAGYRQPRPSGATTGPR
jgi:hypothetical protein